MSTQPLLQRTANKRIALPVRVEPKVAFANERTFLSWLHFTVVLGGLAVGLLNFGDKVRRHSLSFNSILTSGINVLGGQDQRGSVLLRRCALFTTTSIWRPYSQSTHISAAMAVMIYALYTYHWRAASIRRGGKGPYDDRLGPVSPPLHHMTPTSICLRLFSPTLY